MEVRRQDYFVRFDFLAITIAFSKLSCAALFIIYYYFHDLLSPSYLQHCVYHALTGHNSLQTVCYTVTARQKVANS